MRSIMAGDVSYSQCYTIVQAKVSQNINYTEQYENEPVKYKLYIIIYCSNNTVRGVYQNIKRK